MFIETFSIQRGDNVVVTSTEGDGEVASDIVPELVTGGGGDVHLRNLDL